MTGYVGIEIKNPLCTIRQAQRHTIMPGCRHVCKTDIHDDSIPVTALSFVDRRGILIVDFILHPCDSLVSQRIEDGLAPL
jgi:hypothetical protein